MMQKVNMRWVAFLLLLAFFQKMGLELWLHHWLHDPPAIHFSATSVNTPAEGHAYIPAATGVKHLRSDHCAEASLQQQPVKCSCLDDTMMPLIGSDGYVYKAPPIQRLTFLLAPYSSALSEDKTFPALRGPPAASFLL